jgi:hypothetical protein
MVYYITFIIRTRNPDLRSSCFGPRASVLVLRSSCFGPRASVLVLRSYIYGEARYPEMSGVLRCYLIGVFSASYKKGSVRPFIKRFSSYHPEYLWVFIFRVAEKSPSLHLVIFEKGSVRPFIKRFSKLSSRIFMGFYFQGCREKSFSASCHF